MRSRERAPQKEDPRSAGYATLLCSAILLLSLCYSAAMHVYATMSCCRYTTALLCMCSLLCSTSAHSPMITESSRLRSLPYCLLLSYNCTPPFDHSVITPAITTTLLAAMPLHVSLPHYLAHRIALTNFSSLGPVRRLVNASAS